MKDPEITVAPYSTILLLRVYLSDIHNMQSPVGKAKEDISAFYLIAHHLQGLMSCATDSPSHMKHRLGAFSTWFARENLIDGLQMCGTDQNNERGQGIMMSL